MDTFSGRPSGASRYLSLQGVGVTFPVVLGRRREELTVLENVELDVRRGEFCCLIGPSGCGKSTLLRVIDGLLAPTQGRVVIDGAAVTAPRTDLGFVFQSFNLFPWRTVLANVMLGLESQGVPRAERRQKAMEWLRVVGLEGFSAFYPSQLSGGMQQRVGLARALAIRPNILLMDEPFGSVDAQTRLIMQGELMQLWAADQKTVIFVTHDVEEALFLGDRVAVFSPRPGTIVDLVDVPFGRPRLDALRGEPDFARLKESLWERLRTSIEDSTQT